MGIVKIDMELLINLLVAQFNSIVVSYDVVLLFR